MDWFNFVFMENPLADLNRDRELNKDMIISMGETYGSVRVSVSGNGKINRKNIKKVLTLLDKMRIELESI